VHISNLNSSAIVLKEGRKVLIIHGTTETEAVVRPFDTGGIKPGVDGLAIIKTDDPLAAFIGDHFIIRLPTPQVTIGGGIVLDILERYPRRKELPPMTPYLNRRRDGGLIELIRTELAKEYFVPRTGFLAYTNYSAEQVEQAVGELMSSDEAAEFDGNLILKNNISDMADTIRRELQNAHTAKSYLKGLTAEELMRNLRIRDQEQFLLLLKYLENSGELGRSRQFYHLPEFSPALDEKMTRQAESIVKACEAAGHNYLSFAEIEAQFPGSRKTLDFLFEERRLRAIGSHFVMPESIWNEIISYVERAVDNQGKFTVADFRDRFGSSRKYALPVLEFLDRINLTRRDGDYRVKGADYDERRTL
jgi:selenocysteine-specific elongation factor